MPPSSLALNGDLASNSFSRDWPGERIWRSNLHNWLGFILTSRLTPSVPSFLDPVCWTRAAPQDRRLLPFHSTTSQGNTWDSWPSWILPCMATKPTFLTRDQHFHENEYCSDITTSQLSKADPDNGLLFCLCAESFFSPSANHLLRLLLLHLTATTWFTRFVAELDASIQRQNFFFSDWRIEADWWRIYNSRTHDSACAIVADEGGNIRNPAGNQLLSPNIHGHQVGFSRSPGGLVTVTAMGARSCGDVATFRHVVLWAGTSMGRKYTWSNLSC